MSTKRYQLTYLPWDVQNSVKAGQLSFGGYTTVGSRCRCRYVGNELHFFRGRQHMFLISLLFSLSLSKYLFLYFLSIPENWLHYGMWGMICNFWGRQHMSVSFSLSLSLSISYSFSLILSLFSLFPLFSLFSLFSLLFSLYLSLYLSPSLSLSPIFFL